MEKCADMQCCPLPSSDPSDLIPMIVIGVLFLLGGWLLQRRRKKRLLIKARELGEQDVEKRPCSDEVDSHSAH